MSRSTRPATTLLAAATIVAGLAPGLGDARAAASSGVPDDWAVLEDDTGLLTVAAPPDWSDLETAPTPDTAELARITAATDIDAYRSGFDEPGLSLVAVPYDPDTTSLVEDALPAGCRVQADSRYDDGAFVGVMRHWTSCGTDTSTEVFIIAATPINRSLTIRLVIQITEPEQQEIAADILASFNLTYLPDPPTSTTTVVTTPGTTSVAPGPSTSTATSTSGAPSTTPPTTAPTTTSGATSTTTSTTTTTPATTGDTQELRDRSGSLLIEVPASWTDVNLRAAIRNDGIELPNIAASPDLDTFLPSGEDEFLTPGVIYRGLPYAEDTEATLRGIGRLSCVDGGITPYSDDLFSGHIWTFPSCGGTPTRQFIVVANANDALFTALLVIRVTEPGNGELSAVLGSFTYDSSAINASQIAPS